MCCLLIRRDPAPEPNLRSYLVANLTFLVGFFTLAVLLGEAQDSSQTGLGPAAVALLQRDWSHHHLQWSQHRADSGHPNCEQAAANRFHTDRPARRPPPPVVSLPWSRVPLDLLVRRCGQ